MIIGCECCGQILSCTNRSAPTICADCIEKDFEETTGQLCQAKMDHDYPQLIICPVCQSLVTLNLLEYG